MKISQKNGFFLLLIVSFINFSIGKENSNIYAGKKCLFMGEYARWKVDCNWCSCTETGLGRCTLKGCSSVGSVKGTKKKEPDCEGQASWRKDDCTWCLCINGMAHCRTIPCEKEDKDYTGKQCFYTDNNSRWKKDCNWCSCTEKNLGFCTLKGCLKSEPDVDICEGSASWRKDDCTWCDCVDGKAQCKAIPCENKKRDYSGKSCFYNSDKISRWKKDCNWCHCTEKNEGVCELKGCIQRKGAKLQDVDVCEGSASWRKDDCTWCDCVDGKTQCEEIECEKKKPDYEGKSCIYTGKESSWKKDCNWCHCTDSGVGMCTLIGCIKDTKPAEPKCRGSASWRKDDCTWCDCVNGKAQCKTIECSIEKRIEGKKCLHVDEKSRWRNDCNWCTCTKNDLGLCTQKGCLTGYENFIGSDAPECEGSAIWKKDDCTLCQCTNNKAVCKHIRNCNKDNWIDGKECVPTFSEESSWKKDCNWCHCIHPGLGACSRKLCLPEGEDAQAEEPHVEECAGNAVWKRSDDWCKCVKGKAVCGIDNEEVLASKEAVCEEGKMWLDECNTCICEKSEVICTTMDCDTVFANTETDILMEFNGKLRGVVDLLESYNDKGCKQGSSWKEECNWCSCFGNGIGHSCTAMGCIQGPLEGSKCKQGSIWKENCNLCTCPYETPICSAINCEARDEVLNALESSPKTELPHPDIKCTEGSQWLRDCNWCSCINGNDFCTQAWCDIGSESEEKQCFNGSSWKTDDCQWCNCINEKANCVPTKCPDKPPSANKIPPPSDAPIIEFENAACTRGSHWKKDCNWCKCVNGIPICNLAKCTHETATAEDRKCIGNSAWKDECNHCTCINGMGKCTTNKCSRSNTALTKVLRVCKDGNTWIKGCDLCMCFDGIPVCYKRACTKQPESCDPENFSSEGDCNSCKCIDGIRYCTRRSHCPTWIKEKLPSLCYLPPVEEGAIFCGKYDFKYSYYGQLGRCTNTVYGGCGGTDNLFDTEEQCQKVCQPREARSMTKSVTTYSSRKLNKPLKIKVPVGCTQKVDGGPCFAYIKRYGYDQITRQCRPFVYGGCLTNKNNFLTAKECHETCGAIPPVSSMGCKRENCNWERFGHYLSRKCQPIYRGGSCCPTSFKCEHENNLDPNKCYYKNIEYAIGDVIPVENDCTAHCTCISSFVPGQAAEVHCAEVECPSVFGPPLKKGCRRLYRFGECCSYDVECDDAIKNTKVSQREPNCKWDQRTWKLGDLMYFKDNPCIQCVCSADFESPDGPGCKKLECGFDYRHRSKFERKCIPVYYPNQCCPVDWMCPDNDVIEITPSTAGKSAEAQCIYGEKKIALGSKLKAQNCRIDCTCDTPPGLTCVMKRKCDTKGTKIAKAKTDLAARLSCPEECIEEINDGVQECLCDKTLYKCPPITCPENCKNTHLFFDEHLGCDSCACLVE